MKRHKSSSRETKSKPVVKRAAVSVTMSKPAQDYEPRPKIGSEAAFEIAIPHEWTIQAISAALPPVLSTPRMIQMMEHASTLAIHSQLAPGTISVGTRIEVDHLKAVPDGTKVRAHARLAGFQGRFLVFDVEATAGDIVIGRGKVFRAIVQSGRHGEKAKARITDSARPTSK